MCDPEAAEPNAKKINKKTEVFVFLFFGVFLKDRR